MADRAHRQSITAAARSVTLDDVARRLPPAEPVEGQEELPYPDREDDR